MTVYDVTYMWSLKQMYIAKQKQTRRHRKQDGSYQWKKEEGARQGYGIKRFELLCIKQVGNKDILYNSWKYSHYFVIILIEYNLQKH